MEESKIISYPNSSWQPPESGNFCNLTDSSAEYILFCYLCLESSLAFIFGELYLNPGQSWNVQNKNKIPDQSVQRVIHPFICPNKIIIGLSKKFTYCSKSCKNSKKWKVLDYKILICNG